MSASSEAYVGAATIGPRISMRASEADCAGACGCFQNPDGGARCP
jgi:hypothetical protein